ncbi:MAG: M16 family metallopeptidase [Planctomycetota bacterium]|jgi:zinc protease
MTRTRLCALAATLAAALVTHSSVALAIDEGVPPPERAGPSIIEARTDDLAVEVLPNGTCLAVRRAPTAGVVSVQFWVGAGSTTEGDRTGSGISHFVEHMIFEGTVRQPGRGFDLLVRSAGGVHNGYTSLEETVYHVTVPTAGYRKVLGGLVSLVRDAGIPEAEFARERDVVLQELREGLDNPRRLSWRLLAGTVFHRHPYGVPVIGHEWKFDRLTHDDLVDYFKSIYVPGNEIVVLAGDLNVDEALVEARALLSKAPARPLPDLSRVDEPEQTAPRFVEARHARAKKARVTFAWRTVDLLHPDLFALDVLAMVIGQGRSSRLYRTLKEEKGLALATGAYSWTPRDEGLLEIWAQCEDDRVGELRVAVEREVERVRAEAVSPEELARARAQVEAGVVFRRQTAEGLARDLASDLLRTGDPHFSERYLEGVRAVTASDVLEAARNYLVPSRMTVAVFRPERKAPEREAVATETTGAAPEATGRSLDVRDLAGGGRLVLARDGSVPMVSVSATLLAGVRLEPEGRAGVSAMLSKILSKGTRSHSGEALANLVEDRGGSFSVTSGRNSLSIQVTMLAADLPRALDVAAEILAEPALRPEDLELVRKETLADLRSRSENPWRATGDLLRATLYEGHPYRFPEPGTVETVGSITREDLADFHEFIARRGNLVVSVAGDFGPERASELAAKAFARLPRGDTLFDAPGFPKPHVPGARVERVLPGSRSAVVMWGFPGVRMGTKEADCLDVAAEVLGGMSGRLWASVRAEEGLAYAVGAFNQAQVDPGYFALYVATKPETEAKALGLLKAEIARLAAEPPEGDELERAKAGLIGEDAISLQSRGALALRTALYERYGFGAGAALDLRERLAKVSAADVARVVKRYLDPEGGVVAASKPE